MESHPGRRSFVMTATKFWAVVGLSSAIGADVLLYSGMMSYVKIVPGFSAGEVGIPFCAVTDAPSR